MTATRPEPAVLTGRFIRLEPLGPEHFSGLYAALADPAVYRGGYAGGPAGRQRSADDFAVWAAHHYPFGVGNPYAVRILGGAHDGDIVGTTTLADFEPDTEKAHIGWTAYDPRVWGTPVNPEAKLLLLGLAFEHGFGRIKIQTDVINERSRAAIANLGATFEGVTRRDKPRADGTWRDTAVFSILVDEWPAVRAGLEARLARFGDQPAGHSPLPAR